MSKALKALGAIFLGLLLLGGVAIGRSWMLHQDAMRYIQSNLPPILANWNGQD